MRKEIVDKRKISLISNYIIIILSVFAFIVMFTGIKFTYIKEPILESNKLIAFKYFTVDSNLLMLIVSILFAFKERKLIMGDIKEIPVGYYVLKLIGTVSVTLTFLVVFVYLGRIVDGGVISLLQNSNLFFHFIIPVLSIITFVIFEKTDKIKFNYVISSLIPVLLYGIFYVINVITHLENGKVLPKYDWYSFMKNGTNNVFILASVMLVLTYVIGIIIWLINRKR